MSRQRTILIFGAGNIGLTFVGQIFGRSGWRVVFADADPDVVARLAADGGYVVQHLAPDGSRETHRIEPVEAIDARDGAALGAVLAQTPLIATAVGARAFPVVLRSIASALPGDGASPALAGIDIIAAENIHDPRAVAAGLFGPDAPAVHPCSVGKMVPLQTRPPDGPLVVRAEAFNTLIVDGTGWRSPFPADVRWLRPVDRVEAWMDRKLFVHNLGHAVCAWRARSLDGGIETVAEAMAHPAIAEHTQIVMHAAAAVVGTAYPDQFTSADLDEHVADLLARFANRSLGDTVERVGRDIGRKLGREERFVGALLLAAGQAAQPSADAARTLLALAPAVATDALAFGLSDAATLAGDRELSVATLTGARMPSVVEALARLAPLDGRREPDRTVLEALAAGAPA